MSFPDTYSATLRFLAPSDQPPVYRASEGGADAELSLEGEYADERVTLNNGRLAAGLSLDKEGFCLLERPSALVDFYDDHQIAKLYSKEVEKLVQEVTGAKRTLCFDHTRRAHSRAVRGSHTSREPAAVVHNDYTDRSGPQRIQDLLPAEAEALLKGRFAIVNVWRAIGHPAVTSMLALCDASSTQADQLIPTPRIAKDRIGELMLAHYHASQRWLTFPALEPKEALLLKTYDSARDGRARFAIHTAFDNPDPGPEAKPRESIESRVFAFF